MSRKPASQPAVGLSGMTGFARREGVLGEWSWVVEARSVNGRGLEIRLRAPPGFEGLEAVARAAGQARFQRGQVNVTLQARRAESVVAAARVNQAVLDGYLQVTAALVAQGLAAPPTADGLLALRGVVESGEARDDEAARKPLEAAMAADIVASLDGLKLVRREEGAVIAGLVTGFLDTLERLIDAAAALAAEQPALIRARFVQRLRDLAAESIGEDRIAQEAAMLATRADVREELDRLRAHVEAARALLTASGGAGRRLDFLTQEFMREANTLCSKSAASALTAVGLELKATIDQFREQVQNVE